jgi:hypothetical protein
VGRDQIIKNRGFLGDRQTILDEKLWWWKSEPGNGRGSGVFAVTLYQWEHTGGLRWLSVPALVVIQFYQSRSINLECLDLKSWRSSY